MEFRILGPVEVLSDGAAVALPRQKARALLAFLILHANEVVSADVLLAEVWGDRRAKTADNSLRNYVSRLRKALGAEVVVSRPPGYQLRVEADRVDVLRAERLIAAARRAEGEERAAKLRQALALWRGPALADLAYEPFAQTEAPRLEELYLTTLEDRLDADLALGKGPELVAELEGLIGEHPLRERLRGQLMLALYRSGRQADGLEAYQHARRVLVGELGIEPSAALRELERAILRQDEALDAVQAAPRSPTEWRRKPVTVLFADVTAPRDDLVTGALERLRAVAEAHGGNVREVPGGAAVAVFGVPAVHEDDALRAVRAAADLRANLSGGDVEVRIGIRTGDVLAFDADTNVSGDPVVIAKRFAELAHAGEILLGPATLALVRDAVEADAVRPLEVRGRVSRLPAFRLVHVDERAPAIARALDTPLVGRHGELVEFRRAFERVRDERRCVLLALIGEAGIGKTRLARELAVSLSAEADVLQARFPSYGQGATYLPLAELAAQVTGGRPSEDAIAAAVAHDPEARVVARRISELIGVAEGAAAVGEAFWAVRRLVEALARDRPLVLVLDDLHWAEPTFLDLVEYLLEWVADAPVFLVGTARPELLDARPTWAAAAMALEPLGEAESYVLIDHVAGRELGPDARERIVETAEGNPLFVEQLLAFAAETDGVASLPPSLERLIASRLDRLDTGERAVLERAAIAGREFWRGAVVALSPPQETDDLDRHLASLTRSGWIRETRSALTGEDGFRFHHALLRDVAYAEVPKGLRAELHERLADWLDERASGMDELVGSHLEEAFRLRAELGRVDRAARGLAHDAGERLGRAGIRAFKRGDIPATVNLLERATALLPEEDAFRRELLCELGLAHRVGGALERAEAVLAGACRTSSGADDRRLELRAAIELANVRLFSDPANRAPELERRATEAIRLFEAVEDDRGLARAWLILGTLRGDFYCQYATFEDDAARAARHYRLAGWAPAFALGSVAGAIFYGPSAVDDGLRRCDELLREAEGSVAAEASILVWVGPLEAMRGHFEEGRRVVERARAIYADLGQDVAAVDLGGFAAATIERLAGNDLHAERLLREMCEFGEQRHEWAHLATRAAELAAVLYTLERYHEAGEWARLAMAHAAEEDVSAQFSSRSALAKVIAREGALDDAEALARSAVQIVRRTDAINQHAQVLLDLGEVLRLAGRVDEARVAVESALALYERKGNVVAARTARALLGERVPA